MGRIPEETIERIRQTADIVDVVREVVNLKKAGRLWRGQCPFHSEKDPSFTIYPDIQIFKCFGCGEGGSVFTFIQKYYTMTYPEAIRHLGEKHGIEIPETKSDPGAFGRRERLFEVNEMAAGFFQNQLANLPDDSVAIKHLYDRRGLVEKSIKNFEMGYAPDSWDKLKEELSKKKIPEKISLALGLLKSNDQGRKYDGFRNRIMFTFRNAAGKVIGFSGRALDPDDKAKFMNSPDSEIFKKGSNFFGLNIAGREIAKKKRAIVSEGNFDLVLMHQYGFSETVALLGSALTNMHLRLLERYTTNIYLLFDGDEAGVKAMWRSVKLFFPTRIHPKIALLPQGHDPDSFLNEFGGQKLEELIENATLAMDYAIKNLLEKAGDDIEKRCWPLIASVPLSSL